MSNTVSYNCAAFETEKLKTGFTTNNIKSEKAKDFKNSTVCVLLYVLPSMKPNETCVGFSLYSQYFRVWGSDPALVNKVLTLATGATYETNMLIYRMGYRMGLVQNKVQEQTE